MSAHFECYCACHRDKHVKHIVACCSTCPDCGQKRVCDPGACKSQKMQVSAHPRVEDMIDNDSDCIEEGVF